MVDTNPHLSSHKFPSRSQVVEELRKLWGMALPITAMNWLVFAKAFISVLFLGRLGSTALAGVSLSIGFTNITGYSIIVGLSLGLEPICSQAHGSNNWDLLSLSLQRMLLILLLAIIPIAFLWLNLRPIMLFLGQARPITAIAATHCFYSLPDLLTNALLQPLRVFLRSQNETRSMMYCSLVAVVFHAAMNYVLVVRMGLGVPGIAVASVATNAATAGMIAGYAVWLWRKKKARMVRLWREGTEGGKLGLGLGEVVRLAVPSCVGMCMEWWWYETVTLMTGYLPDPTLTVAASGILIHTTTMLYTVPLALAAAASARVGNELGADQPYKAKLAANVALGCSFVVGFINLIWSAIFRDWWAGLFTEDELVKALVVMVMPIMGLCELANCPQTTCSGILRGMARPVIRAHINLGSFYFVGTPVAVGLAFLYKAGFIGLWFGLVAAQIICAVLNLYVVMVHTDWESEALKAKNIMGSCNKNRETHGEKDEEIKGLLVPKNGDKNIC